MYSPICLIFFFGQISFSHITAYRIRTLSVGEVHHNQINSGSNNQSRPFLSQKTRSHSESKLKINKDQIINSKANQSTKEDDKFISSVEKLSPRKRRQSTNEKSPFKSSREKMHSSSHGRDLERSDNSDSYRVQFSVIKVTRMSSKSKSPVK